LDVPVMTSRDGPIASIDLDRVGTLASAELVQPNAGPATGEPSPVQVVAEVNPGIELLAVRPSWVQVSAADGTVLFEKILDAGERYTVPPLEDAPLLRAGNSGSVYFLVNGQTFGPAAPGANVVRNVALTAENLSTTYTVADMSEDADLAKILNVADAGDTAGTVAPAEAPIE
jgi:hypothetical protein